MLHSAPVVKMEFVTFLTHSAVLLDRTVLYSRLVLDAGNTREIAAITNYDNRTALQI